MALDAISEKFLREREDFVGRAEGIKRTALEQGRPLNEAEITSLESFRAKVTELDAQLAVTTQSFDLDEQVSQRIASISGAPTVKRGANPWEGMSAGQVIYDYMHAREAGSASEARVSAFARYHARAAEHMGTDATLTVPVAGGFGGLILKPIVGPIIDLSPKESPLLGLIGTQDAPNAMTFSRPRIVDEAFTTAAQPQTLQKQELSSKAFQVKGEEVSLQTYGNYLNLSLQAETFVAGSIDTVLSQLVARTVYALEVSVGTELGKTTKIIPLAPDADAATVLAAWQQAQAAVYSATRRPPQWAVAGISGWARLSGLSDAAGRPLFPAVGGAVNALGTSQGSSMVLNVNGVPLAVSLGITGDEIFMGNSFGLETYVHRYPVLSAIEPSVLGRQIAAAASIGHYQPPTTEAGPGGTPAAKREGIVQIGGS